jgi:hypothetical protein
MGFRIMKICYVDAGKDLSGGPRGMMPCSLVCLYQCSGGRWRQYVTTRRNSEDQNMDLD